MLPSAGHRPQCTRPAAASFTSASQPPPPPPAASRTAPHRAAQPRSPAPGCAAAIGHPPPALSGPLAWQPGHHGRPALPTRHCYWPSATLFLTSVGLYACLSLKSRPYFVQCC